MSEEPSEVLMIGEQRTSKLGEFQYLMREVVRQPLLISAVIHAIGLVVSIVV